MVIQVNYSTAPEDTTLTGLGLRMYYNSQMLTLDSVGSVLGTGFIQQSPPMDDTGDTDQDPATDKYVLIAWADPNGDWPNEAPAQLLTATFTASATDAGHTSINFTASSTAAGWTFTGTSAAVTILRPVAQSSISGYVYVDANGNGQYDASEALPGVTVTLGGTEQATTQTNADGYYQFTGLKAGVYDVTQTPPAACFPGRGPTRNRQRQDRGNGGRRGRFDRWNCVIHGPKRRQLPVPGSKSEPAVDSEPIVGNLDAAGRVAGVERNDRQYFGPAQQQSGQTDPAPAAVSPAPAAATAMTTLVPSASALATPALQAAAVMPAPMLASANQPLAAAKGTSPANSAAGALTPDQLEPIVNAAIANWAAAGLSSATVNMLRKVQFSITDLPGSYLGWTEDNQILLDANADGFGWFVDPTPGQNQAFQPTNVPGQLQAVDPRAVDHMDLLTVVEHELGLAAGLSDLDPSLDNLMSSTLGAGIRREVSTRDVDAVFANYS